MWQAYFVIYFSHLRVYPKNHCDKQSKGASRHITYLITMIKTEAIGLVG